jgi:hypothetical protein
MRRGGGKNKGSAFERKICKQLSLWVSLGKQSDCFWRSAISGGRATVQHRKGVKVRQSGDICSVSPEGHALTNNWYIECKHYKDLDVASFILKGVGNLAKFWRTTKREAERHDKDPLLIAKQNNQPVLVITTVIPGRDCPITAVLHDFKARQEVFILLFDDLVNTSYPPGHKREI